jgi:hypothetical protein
MYHLLQQSVTQLFVYSVRVGFVYFSDVNMSEIIPFNKTTLLKGDTDDFNLLSGHKQ